MATYQLLSKSTLLLTLHALNSWINLAYKGRSQAKCQQVMDFYNTDGWTMHKNSVTLLDYPAYYRLLCQVAAIQGKWYLLRL